MSLDKSCKKYLNRLVLIKPVFGWCWSNLENPDIPVPAQINGVPFSFHCRIRGFFYFEGSLCGAVGKIEEMGHIYDKFLTFFYLRISRICNFTSEPGYYNIEINLQRPKVPLGKKWFEFPVDSLIVNGYALIAQSFGQIERHNVRQEMKWQIVRDAINGEF